MNRIAKKFATLKKNNKKALIVYMTAGDPSLQKNKESIFEFEKNGVDLIELGVPFSDPLADGPVIQEASNRSLARKTNLIKILALVKETRKKSQIPILLMSYLNPILQYGYERFAKDAKNAGVDGVIVPDLPPEEGAEIAPTLKRAGLDLVYLLAPTSTPERTRRVAKASRGFIYFVSITGVTGSATPVETLLRAKLKEIKKSATLPVCVGFGISTPAQAKAAAKSADGVIVGSAIVKALATHPKLSASQFAARFIKPFAKALGKGI